MTYRAPDMRVFAVRQPFRDARKNSTINIAIFIEKCPHLWRKYLFLTPQRSLLTLAVDGVMY
jgi:hypothetical protein